MTTTGVEDSPDRSHGSFEEVVEEVSQVGDISHDDVEDPQPEVNPSQFRTPRFNFPRPDPLTQGLARTQVSPRVSTGMGPTGFALTEEQFKVWMEFQVQQAAQ